MCLPELQGNLVVLRPLQRAYFSAYLQALSLRVQAALAVGTLNGERSYLQSCLEEMHQGRTIFYCIFSAVYHEVIGALEIRTKERGSGQFYGWINECYWGKGHFQEALIKFKDFYFSSTHEQQVNARVDATNRRSYQALIKCGFAPAGIVHGPRGKQYELVLRKK